MNKVLFWNSILLEASRRDHSQGYANGNWSDLIVFAILIVFMLVRPTGLLGTRAIQKV